MRAISRINNNAAICEDGAGHQLVALGRGIGFGELPREISLADVRRTFYGIDAKYLAFIDEVDPEMLEFAAQFADIVTQQVSYELSPNLPVTLADHFQFAVKRAREHIVVSMPFAEDVEQLHPIEYHLGELAIKSLAKTFHVHMPRSEASGVAMSIVNAMVAPSTRTAAKSSREEHLLDKIVDAVESGMGVAVNRSTFAYSRFSTHVRYLFRRMETNSTLDEDTPETMGLYETLARECPDALACSRRISGLIEDVWGSPLGVNELVYLTLHVNRLASQCRAA